MKQLFKISLLPIIFILTSCGSAMVQDDLYADISSVVWYSQNIDKSFWSNGTTGASNFMYSTLYYKGEDVNKAEFHRVQMIKNNEEWNFYLGEDTFNREKKKIGGMRSFSKKCSTNGSVLPIGSVEYRIELDNGYKSKKTVTIPVPGELSNNGYKFVYNEDYTGTTDSTYVQALKRATVTSQTKGASDITVKFTVTDNRVFSGRLFLFNSSKKLIAYTPVFRSFAAGKTVNKAILSDGSENTLNYTSSSISYENGYTFSNISAVAVQLTDGAQYLSDGSKSYNYESISVKVDF